MAASCWRSRFLRLGRQAALWTALGLKVHAADAAGLPSTYCPIERLPALDWIRLAKGDDCALDEDGNGLDDAVESALAACFVPEVVFDSRENALRVDEPHVLFSAHPIGPRVIRFHFAFLFARDGGYVLGSTFPCTADDHAGDDESVVVDVALNERDRAWFGAPLAMRTRDARDDVERVASVGSSPDAMELTGTHPVLYATAGKHHWLHHPESLTYACNCGPLGRCGSVRDRADGAGARVIPVELGHAPGFYVERGGLRSQVPVDDDGGGFWNACSLGSRGLRTRALSLVSNDLGVLGYPGERIFGSCFRGGLGGVCAETISVAQSLAWDKAFSTDFRPRKLLSMLMIDTSNTSKTERSVLPPLGSVPGPFLRN